MNTKYKIKSLIINISPYKWKLRYAFSLIELSIVLIIIGLLVAGVTGGKSLIESAKHRALLNEINGWKQSVYTFYAAQGRLPGDIKNKGTIGVGSGYSNSDFPAGTFSAPYDTAEGISAITAPFVEMYLEGVSDFKPDPEDSSADKRLPRIKIFNTKNTNYKFHNFPKNGSSDSYSDGVLLSKPYLMLTIGTTVGKTPFAVKSLKYIDEKIDDGIFNNGSVRGLCVSNGEDNVTYDAALQSVKDNIDKSYCVAQFIYLGV